MWGVLCRKLVLCLWVRDGVTPTGMAAMSMVATGGVARDCSVGRSPAPEWFMGLEGVECSNHSMPNPGHEFLTLHVLVPGVRRLPSKSALSTRAISSGNVGP